MILAAWWHGVLATIFALLAALLMGVILLQRGKGVGLSGAFGGAGGHTAFGAKTGDVLTWATIALAITLLAYTVGLNFAFRPPAPLGGGAQPTATPTAPANTPAQTPTTGQPTGDTPMPLTPVEQAPAPMTTTPQQPADTGAATDDAAAPAPANETPAADETPAAQPEQQPEEEPGTAQPEAPRG